MVRTLAIFTFTSLIASSALADEIAIKPKLTHSQLNVDAKAASMSGLDIGLKNSNNKVNGTGFGVDFEFRLVDRAKFGAEVSVANYEKDNRKANDMALGGYLAYDFLAQDNFSVYGKAGLGMHQFALEDFKSASLLNTDLGVGVAFALAPQMDLGGEYKYSTTLGKGDMSSEGSSNYKLQDVSIERSDLSVFVAFKF